MSNTDLEQFEIFHNTHNHDTQAKLGCEPVTSNLVNNEPAAF